MDNESQNDEWDFEDELLSGVSSEALLNDDDVELSLSTNVLEKENINEPKEDFSESTLASNNETENMQNSFAAGNIKKCENGNDLKESEMYKIKKGKSMKFKNCSNLLEKKTKINNRKSNIHFPIKEWHKMKKTKLIKFKNSSVSQKKKIKINKKSGTRFSSKAVNSSWSNNIPSLLSLDTKQFNIKQAFKVPNVTENSLPSLLYSLPEYWPSNGTTRNIDTQKLNNQARFKKYDQRSARYCDQKHFSDNSLPTIDMNSSFSNSFSCNRAGNDFVHSETSNNLFNDSETRISDNYSMNQNLYNDHSNSSSALNRFTNDFQHYRNKNIKSKQLYITPNWQNKEGFINNFINSAKIENEFGRKEFVQNNEQVRMKKKRKRKNVFLKKSLQLNNLTLTNNIIEGQKKKKSSSALHNLNKQEQETFEIENLGTHWIDKKYVLEMEEERSRRIANKQLKVLNSKEIFILDNKDIFAQKPDKPHSFREDVDVKKIANLRRVPEVEIIDEVNPFVNIDSWKSSICDASDSEKTWSHLNGSIVKIRNLPSGMTIKDLSLLCLPVGKPIETKLYFPRENAASIRFRERATAENFYKLFHNREIHENILEVIII